MESFFSGVEGTPTKYTITGKQTEQKKEQIYKLSVYLLSQYFCPKLNQIRTYVKLWYYGAFQLL